MITKTFNSILVLLIFFASCSSEKEGIIMTVSGPVSSSKMGTTLTHEHVLVDFIGADSISFSPWNKTTVAEKVLPFLRQIKNPGFRTFVECTPEYIGRDPLLLKLLSDSSGLNIITNTGYYGASNDKYMPKHAYDETAEELADRWIRESEYGIDGTGIKPGFIKIGVGPGHLSDLHRKIVKAAALTHLKTGLTIASHTGPAIPAFEQLEILQSQGVSSEAFIWVHAQNEKDISTHIRAARMGAWISLDGVNNDMIGEYVKMIKNMKNNNLLSKVLLSHDSGWYHPGEVNGGKINGYTAIFDNLIPGLLKEGFSEKEIEQIMIINPQKAFTIRVRGI
jgi:phosphotriesterase-related protein